MRQRQSVPPNQQSFRKLSQRIVRWFEANARDLPWRRTKDPYAIWISEVMLQQTQVKTVIPYWERWMSRFPHVRAIAEASEEDVLKAWEGLGYYSRARNIQKAARLICEQPSGLFPSSFQDILDLPGIGRYTAGAICSIAFGQATPILDGNVARVLARLFAVHGSIKDRTTQSSLWDLSTRLVSASPDCSALNEGLMELGATVCLPRSPLCSQCPVRRSCHAYQKDRLDEFPSRPEAPQIRHRQFVAFIFCQDHHVLVRKRAETAVNRGLWEFPNLEIEATKRTIPEQVVHEYGLESEPVATIKHTITCNRITLRAFAGQVDGRAAVLAKNFDAEWRAISDLPKLPFSSAHAKLRAIIQSRQKKESMK